MRIIKNVIIPVALLLSFGCNKFIVTNKPSIDPEQIYDDFWNAMNKNYALFPLKGINWDSIYSIYRPRVNHNLSQEELFNIISESLLSLKDGHVTITSSNDTTTYEGFYKEFPINFNLYNVLNYYLNNQYTTRGPFIYKMQSKIGYLYNGSFRTDFTDNDLDQIFNDLNSSDGLIIDVRNNSGGDLGNVNRLFSRFIQSKLLVKYEIKKNGPDHSAYAKPDPYYVSNSVRIYDKPIVLLTNRSCFSACNDFVLFMSNLDRVTIVGDQTGGGGAIPTDYLLINGWRLQYSASMTVSPDMVNIENGISPDIHVDINAIDEANGRDPILEKAIELLQ